MLSWNNSDLTLLQIPLFYPWPQANICHCSAKSSHEQIEKGGKNKVTKPPSQTLSDPSTHQTKL